MILFQSFSWNGLAARNIAIIAVMLIYNHRSRQISGHIMSFATPLLCWGAQFVGAQIVVSPSNIFYPGSTGIVGISDVSGANVKFKYAGVKLYDNLPNFLMVFPSSGTTPAGVHIVLNPNVASHLRPASTYGLAVQFTTADQTPESTANALVTYKVPAEPRPQSSP